MRLQDYDTTTRLRAAVVSSLRITPDTTDEVRELLLELDDADFVAEPGQSIGVLAPGQREFGQEHHFRLYSIADVLERTPEGQVRLRICVRRCTYVDAFSGEEYRGTASHFLCDLQPGEAVTITGPYGLAFAVPHELDANLILVGAGTGIAPFRAFIKNLYQNVAEFSGRVLLLHGGRTGMDLLYMNDRADDFALYYDQPTFEAIAALSPRPHWTKVIDWRTALEPRRDELARMLAEDKTYVYIAGLEWILDELDQEFAESFGSEEAWSRRKAELGAGLRWVQLVY